MLSAYPACFYKEGNGFSVIFPDLNYLSTCGTTLEEAFSNAIDCLAGYLFELKMENEPFPKFSQMQDISTATIASEVGFTYSEAFVNLMTVDVEEYAKTHFCKSVKKTLSIPEWMNKEALAAGINFSQVLQEALMLKLRAK